MRDLINLGKMPGPRMFVAGYGLQNTRGTNVTPNTAHGPEEVDKVARAQVAAGADGIKMYASTGSGQDVTGTRLTTSRRSKRRSMRPTRLGKRIAVHSYGPEGARDAVRAGVDSLEHATDMDDDTIAEIARQQDRLRSHHRSQPLLRRQPPVAALPPEAVDRLNDYIERNLETARKAVAAGVRSPWGRTRCTPCSAKIRANWVGS